MITPPTQWGQEREQNRGGKREHHSGKLSPAAFCHVFPPLTVASGLLPACFLPSSVTLSSRKLTDFLPGFFTDFLAGHFTDHFPGPFQMNDRSVSDELLISYATLTGRRKAGAA